MLPRNAEEKLRDVALEVVPESVLLSLLSPGYIESWRESHYPLKRIFPISIGKHRTALNFVVPRY
jgi:hypothetical protein